MFEKKAAVNTRPGACLSCLAYPSSAFVALILHCDLARQVFLLGSCAVVCPVQSDTALSLTSVEYRQMRGFGDVLLKCEHGFNSARHNRNQRMSIST